MGTEHLKPSSTTTPTSAEIAEQAIDWLENIGYPLVPWQAEALRAMLTYPVGTKFTVMPPRQRTDYDAIQKAWWLGEAGDRADQVVDEYEDSPPQPGTVKVIRDGEWVWEKPCPCSAIDLSQLTYDWQCSQCGKLHEKKTDTWPSGRPVVSYCECPDDGTNPKCIVHGDGRQY